MRFKSYIKLIKPIKIVIIHSRIDRNLERECYELYKMVSNRVSGESIQPIFKIYNKLQEINKYFKLEK